MSSAALLVADLRRVRREEYHRMIDASIFDEDERIELLEGVIVRMSPQKEDHALVVERLADRLFTGAPQDLVVRCQLPLALGEDSEPEPDVAILARPARRSLERAPSEALLVFEVARDSLAKDRTVKGALYARESIPEYVVVDPRQRTLEFYTQPDPAERRYGSLRVLQGSDRFESTAAPGVVFDVEALFAEH